MISRHVTEHFDAKLDGQLTAAEQAHFESHLADCPECHAAWREYETMWRQLSVARNIQPSHGFTERVMRQLDATPQPSRAPFLRFPAWQWGLATAAAIAFAFTLVIHFRTPPAPELTSSLVTQREEIKVAENLDMLQDFEMIAVLDLLEKELPPNTTGTRGTL